MRPLVVVALLAGCSHGSASSDAPVAPLVAASSDDVVATVDGRPIYAAAVAAQARARGVDKRAALADLVDAEVLAGEAARRGLDQDLDVRLETKGALGRRYLAATFERDVTPAQVPDAIVRREYQRRLPYLNHGLYADVWHILIPVAKTATPADRAQARARAESLAARAKGLSLDQFKQLAADEKLFSEEIATARDGWVERPFSEAAFTQLKKPGDTTGVVATSFGFHIEHLIRWIPPEHVTLADAAPKIREGVFPEWRKQAFARFLDEAVARHRVELHAEHLQK